MDHLQRELHCKSKFRVRIMNIFNTFIFHGTYLRAQDELEDKSHHWGVAKFAVESIYLRFRVVRASYNALERNSVFFDGFDFDSRESVSHLVTWRDMEGKKPPRILVRSGP